MSTAASTVKSPARLRVIPATGTCLDCGEPVHLVPGACAECDGTPVYYHDSGAAEMACPGTSPHVRARMTAQEAAA